MAVNKSKISLQELVSLALLVAMDVVLQKISFGPSTLKVGLGFIGLVLLGYYFGPVWGSIGAGISDVLGTAFFGADGGFFLGFTFSAIVATVIYGLFFYQKPIKIWRIVSATLLVTLVVNVVMNTYWVHLLYGLDLRAALVQRILKELIVPWIQMIVVYFVLNAVQRVKIKK